MMQALSLDELMDIGDEQYERLVVEPAVAAIRIRERAKLLRAYMPVLRAIYKCGGRADVGDVAEETGMRVSQEDLSALRPWVRWDGDQLWLTTVGQSVMRREMVADEQH